MYKVLALNNISKKGLDRLPAERYQASPDMKDPHAILLRSFNMHSMDVPKTLLAVGRAGAGVNNIPVPKMSELGIPVFNAPGANANAVKELVIAGMLLSYRHICQAWDFSRGLTGSDEEIHKAVEAGKKKFAGFELPGRTLGIVGLGSIGRYVANAAVSLGMNVVGFDPGLTVEGAWQLSSSVRRAKSVEDVVRNCDFLTFHVPLNDKTRNMLNAERVAQMRSGAVVLNFARDGIIDDAAVVAALDSGKLYGYVCDFPSNALQAHERVIALPHLGASTAEAEENCAVMVADQVRDFLENGNIRNAVNFPEVIVARGSEHRFIIANANVPNMLGQISEAFGQAGINIHDMVNMSKGELAYTVVDTDSPVPADVQQRIRDTQGVMMVRSVPPPQG